MFVKFLITIKIKLHINIIITHLPLLLSHITFKAKLDIMFINRKTLMINLLCVICSINNDDVK